MSYFVVFFSFSFPFPNSQKSFLITPGPQLVSNIVTWLKGGSPTELMTSFDPKNMTSLTGVLTNCLDEHLSARCSNPEWNLKTNWAPCKFENPHDPRNPQNLQQKTLTKRQFQKDLRCQKVQPAKSWRHPQKRSAQPPPRPHNWGLVVERRVDWWFVYHCLPFQENRFRFID